MNPSRQEADQALTSTEPTFSPSPAPVTPSPTEDENDSLVQPGHRVFDSQLPPELSGSLKMGRRIVEGTYADVFEGTLEMKEASWAQVAIKNIRCVDGAAADKARFETRIRREVFIWKTANHRNILRFIGYKVVDGFFCLISPWCQHGNLAQYIAKNTEMKDSGKLKLLCDAARGLAHLHSLTPLIVHGDIKPDNVLVTDNLEASLCDFGLSRLFFDCGGETGLTTTGNMAGGTVGYLSKQAIENNDSMAPRDVYAFGGLILAAMSGRNPFWRRKNDCARIVAILGDQIPSPDDHESLQHDDSLWTLLRKCWNSNPTSRPPINVVLQELETEMKAR
ncbi:hypothetical protein FRC01_010805 [Tulasnella sp. 417]|nr:hypothetical protein FRC01_010805 [Tulasnella sp. 417]